MLLSLNWLKDHLAKLDLKIDPKSLSDKLTMRGLHVAAIKRPAFSLENVVVGRIEKIEKHPNADRLQVVQVITKISDTPEFRQIVCGAKNRYFKPAFNEIIKFGASSPTFMLIL